MAARVRCRLFASVIVQDIAFFDANKTGEIVNRCGMITVYFKIKIVFGICIDNSIVVFLVMLCFLQWCFLE